MLTAILIATAILAALAPVVITIRRNRIAREARWANRTS